MAKKEKSPEELIKDIAKDLHERRHKKGYELIEMIQNGDGEGVINYLENLIETAIDDRERDWT